MKIFDILYGILLESIFLFIDMAPYIFLGMTLAGILSVIISREMVGRHIGSHNFTSILKASLFGVPLPLCSCGVIPAAVYIKKAGASNSAVMSFLISTPQTGVDSFIATYALMGPFFAVLRPVSALIAGVWGGLLSLFFDRDKAAGKELFSGSLQAHEVSGGDEAPGSCSCSADSDNDDSISNAGPVGSCDSHSSHSETKEKSVKGKLKKIYNFAFVEFMDDIALQFVVGIVIAGLISYLVPDNFFVGTVFSEGIAGMILMIILGIPIYVCSTTSIPIALALLAKGISPGAAYVFLIAGPATNAASLSILLKLLGKKQTIIYVFSIITGSLVSGLFIDFAAQFSDVIPEAVRNGEAVLKVKDNPAIDILLYLSSAFFLYLLIAAFYRKIRKPVSCSAAGCAH